MIAFMKETPLEPTRIAILKILENMLDETFSNSSLNRGDIAKITTVAKLILNDLPPLSPSYGSGNIALQRALMRALEHKLAILEAYAREEETLE